MAGTILWPVLEFIRRDLALSLTSTGLVLTVHGLSLALASPLIGRAIDRYRDRRPSRKRVVQHGPQSHPYLTPHGAHDGRSHRTDPEPMRCARRRRRDDRAALDRRVSNQLPGTGGIFARQLASPSR